MGQQSPDDILQALSREALARKRRKKRITEDDPRWNPATMGNRRGNWLKARHSFTQHMGTYGHGKVTGPF